ncbi:MAG: winged helix DNA-binding domain-containing protein [Chloroflexota bacterium]|nr:winged helix DNA-binding domain-containing protein [Chloroflexota bacterium]MDE2910421.1 winged helix DNA-binding domain-containing protein [Chloroflexota bacterium]
MRQQLTWEEARKLRTRRQLLCAVSRRSSAAEIVPQLFALQSQEWSSAQLAIHARARGITQADVVHAREVERAFVLTWTLRGALHLVASEDIGLQLELCGPPAIRGSRSRYKQLGLSEDVREKTLIAIEDILSGDNALTRAQLADALAARGIPTAGQAIHHLARFAALSGLICLGAEVDGDLTYTLLDEWLRAAQPARQPDNPLAHFARRYLAAYGPATMADFKRWSGLPAAQVKQAWAAISAECLALSLPDGEALILERHLEQLEAPPNEPTVRLLPRYDNYLLGYASRVFMVDAAYAKQVHPGGGLIRACLFVDGEAKANWKLEKRRAGLRVVVEPFEALERSIFPSLEAEVESLGRFLDTDAELRVASG